MSEVEVNATDGAKKRAAELGLTDALENGDIVGSGENKRVQANDVQDYWQARGAGEDPAGAEAEETTPNADPADLEAEAEEDDEEEVDEFDEPQGEKIGRELVPHLTDTGLDILEVQNDDDEILSAIEHEREVRSQVPDDEGEEEAIDLLKRFARIMQQPMSRSQVARRSQRLLTELGVDWRKG